MRFVHFPVAVRWKGIRQMMSDNAEDWWKEEALASVSVGEAVSQEQRKGSLFANALA
jgi:hypothetical protein